MHYNILFDRVQNLIQSYDFSQPFSLYLKEIFRNNPKMGARDRRETRDYCYHFLRLGRNLENENFKTKLAVASFICSSTNSSSLETLLTENSKLSVTDLGTDTNEKIEIIKKQFPEFSIEKIFADMDLLSDDIDKNAFALSFLIQPRVYIRIRRNFVKDVFAELEELKIPFEKTASETVLSFAPMQKLEHMKTYIEGYFEIQDINSQRITDFYSPQKDEKWWDACAASGGKSLALIDKEEAVFLLATDLRENILKNYSMRMKKVGFKGFNTQAIDLTKNSIDPSDRFDGILADVPCSGSGTWSRSPENLHKNPKTKVKEVYQPLQRKIVANCVKNLRLGGTLVYSTCSVFSAENQDNIAYFQEKLPLKLIESALISGYEMKADSLFVARFEKVSDK
ncbi:MAG: RsmB/NOP family class I SAM-dependent RNA methyltransferase [Bacteroidetes bacterium]|nr:RsmB/NOP family class I SAM-dependent RNA methyltransferase [Bacteroidota bacterium]